MVARIAPSPITTSVAVGDALSHATMLKPQPAPLQKNFAESGEFTSSASTLQAASGEAPPPSLPGEAFAAAVIAGQLAPRPVTPQQLLQRLGSAWQPPASPLRLMDKSA
ncbi:MAG: hypothetical protein ABIY37_08920 [Devosia sp.]